mmetsp:Transcript_29190/g.59824  ORF Transcript_29190/g.59824 Transcript_29190/m.59824 type:complete len:132 (-) Transcript_29190:139-534(-)
MIGGVGGNGRGESGDRGKGWDRDKGGERGMRGKIRDEMLREAVCVFVCVLRHGHAPFPLLPHMHLHILRDSSWRWRRQRPRQRRWQRRRWWRQKGQELKRTTGKGGDMFDRGHASQSTNLAPTPQPVVLTD